MTIKQIWAQMPRQEKIATFAVPPAFLALFWVLWVITPA